MTPVSPSSPAVPPWTLRLVEQLQLISEVSETLTVRLLELEERLADQERELAGLREQAQGSAELPAGLESWLEQSEERLLRLEELLGRGAGRASGGSGSAARPLKAVAPAQSRPAPPVLAGQDLEADPFPEEAEQPFLDEQIA